MNPISLLNTHHTDFERITYNMSIISKYNYFDTHTQSFYWRDGEKKHSSLFNLNSELLLVLLDLQNLTFQKRLWKKNTIYLIYKTKQCSKKRGNFSRLLPKVTLSGFYRHLWIVWLLVLHCQLLLSKLSSHQNTLNPKISKEFWSKN